MAASTQLDPPTALTLEPYLVRLPLDDLESMCRVSHAMAAACRSATLWRARALAYFPPVVAAYVHGGPADALDGKRARARYELRARQGVPLFEGKPRVWRQRSGEPCMVLSPDGARVFELRLDGAAPLLRYGGAPPPPPSTVSIVVHDTDTLREHARVPLGVAPHPATATPPAIAASGAAAYVGDCLFWLTPARDALRADGPRWHALLAEAARRHDARPPVAAAPQPFVVVLSDDGRTLVSVEGSRTDATVRVRAFRFDDAAALASYGELELPHWAGDLNDDEPTMIAHAFVQLSRSGRRAVFSNARDQFVLSVLDANDDHVVHMQVLETAPRRLHRHAAALDDTRVYNADGVAGAALDSLPARSVGVARRLDVNGAVMAVLYADEFVVAPAGAPWEPRPPGRVRFAATALPPKRLTFTAAHVSRDGRRVLALNARQLTSDSRSARLFYVDAVSGAGE